MSDIRDRVEEQLKEEHPQALFADGFDECIIGIARRACKEPLVAYDREKCIQTLVDRDGMSREDAEEFFEFNTIGAWVGEGTPIFIDTAL